MKVPSYRTFTTVVNHIKEDFNISEYKTEATRARGLLRKMVANPDYEAFKPLNREAVEDEIRMQFKFKEGSNKIYLTIADKDNPTSRDAIQTFRNLFKRKGNEVPLPTMTDKECRNFFKRVLNPLDAMKDFPLKKIEFDPEQPYAEKIEKALSDFYRERLFGGCQKRV